MTGSVVAESGFQAAFVGLLPTVVGTLGAFIGIADTISRTGAEKQFMKGLAGA